LLRVVPQGDRRRPESARPSRPTQSWCSSRAPPSTMRAIVHRPSPTWCWPPSLALG
jgi:hypothetical protein